MTCVPHTTNGVVFCVTHDEDWPCPHFAREKLQAVNSLETERPHDDLARLIDKYTTGPTATEAAIRDMQGNPEAVLRALGFPDRVSYDVKECADRWVCCIHPLSAEERARA